MTDAGSVGWSFFVLILLHNLLPNILIQIVSWVLCCPTILEKFKRLVV